MRWGAPVTLAMLLLGACATPAVRAPTEAGAPAPVAGLDWFGHRDDADLSLAYGREASDELRLRLDCRAGSGTLSLTAPAHGDERSLHLESGGDTERFPARAEPSGMGDGELLIAEGVALNQPVFQRFRALGWIAAWRDETREVYVAQPGSAPAVTRFFQACETG